MVTQTNKKKGRQTPKAPTKQKATSKVVAKKSQSTQKTAKPTKPVKTPSKATASTARATPKKVEPKAPPRKASRTTTPKAAKEQKSTVKTQFVPPVERSGLHESMMPYKFAAYHPKTGEAYMSDLQLKHFREILETWKKELMKEVDNTISEMKGASVLADPNDRATQEEAFNLELRTRDRERKLIRKIEEALQQIDDKEYGYCESCGIEIGIRRLEARPTAVLCIDCKTLDEIRERTTQ